MAICLKEFFSVSVSRHFPQPSYDLKEIVKCSVYMFNSADHFL